MKKIFYIAATLSLALVACQKNELAEPSAQQTSDIKIVATVIDTGTKTVLSDDGDVLKTTWVAGDKIGVFGHLVEQGTSSEAPTVNSCFTADDSGRTATFSYVSGSNYFWLWEQGKPHTFYTYYPFSSDNNQADSLAICFAVPEIQVQEKANSSAHLALTDLLYAESTIQKGNVNDAIRFSFKRALSALDISLTSGSALKVSDVRVALDDENDMLSVSEGYLDPRDGSLDIKAGASDIALSLRNEAPLTEVSSHFYIQITPGHAGRILSVYASVKGVETKVGSVKIPAGGIPVGVMAQLPAFEVKEAVGGEYVDLSAGGSSNCYIISSTGNYKFKATVKGNGSIPSELSAVVGNEAITPQSALILWYNTVQDNNEWKELTPVNVSSVSLKDGYICFSTPAKFISGNVVIAAFAEEGVTYDNIEVDSDYNITNATLLWSWNIWAAEGYDPEASPLIADGKKLMDRNLGAPISGIGTTGEYEPAAALGNVYQWGRKDPFPNFPDYGNASYPCSNYSNSLFALPTWTPVKALGLNGQGKQGLNAQMFGYKHNDDGSLDLNNAENMPLKSDISAETVKNEVYVGYATRNPYKIIKGTPVSSEGSYAWLSTKDKSWESLWGAEKTLYDPCPAGWRVWSSAEATDFLNSFVESAQMASNLHGYIYAGYYFPLAGRGRDSQHGRVDFVASTGNTTESNFWCSDSCPHLSDWGHACKFWAPRNYSATNYTPECNVSATVHPAAGYSVRCVKE